MVTTVESKKSIGEVLAVLKQEFPDMTISKIRFLESRGLVEPERTTSGYRKFSTVDIDRLRFILREQRENFLPLKVIRERLEESFAPVTTPRTDGDSTPSVLLGGATLDRAELLNASGLSESQLRELETFGIVSRMSSRDTSSYDEAALIIARLAARLLDFGVEPRHLRSFKTAADREADLYRQLTVQVRGSRNTAVKMEAQARLDELIDIGRSIHAELVRQAVTR